MGAASARLIVSAVTPLPHHQCFAKPQRTACIDHLSRLHKVMSKRAGGQQCQPIVRLGLSEHHIVCHCVYGELLMYAFARILRYTLRFFGGSSGRLLYAAPPFRCNKSGERSWWAVYNRIVDVVEIPSSAANSLNCRDVSSSEFSSFIAAKC